VVMTESGYKAACPIYYRVSSQSGGGIPGAVAIESTRPGEPHIADSYGRIYFAVPRDSEETVKIAADGYASETVELVCGFPVADLQRAVVLRENSR